MKLTILPLLALASAVLAAPMPAAEAEAAANPGYSDYGSYPPPKGGYGKYPSYGKYSGYGSYKRAEDKVEKRDAADYGSYPAPAGGYGEYGSYSSVPVPADVPVPATVPAPAGGYGDYGSYPEPAGGYGSYGSYKRSILEFVKRVWN